MAVVCGEDFTVVVTEQGDLWAFGQKGVLGRGTDADELLPALVGGADEVFDGESVVMVAAGIKHTACVTSQGTLWTWGAGGWGQLGHGDEESRQRPARIGEEKYGGSPAVAVACGQVRIAWIETRLRATWYYLVLVAPIDSRLTPGCSLTVV